MNRLFLALLALLFSASSWADRQTETNNTTTFSKKIEMKLEPHSGICQATAQMDYFQRGAEAQVETSIDTQDCSASSGNFVVRLTIRADGDQESKVLNFEETWERNDDAPVKSVRRYPIGDDVDLLRVRTRNLSCTCAEESAEDNTTE